MLLTKFELGLFEKPYVSSPEAAATSNTPHQRALARTLARKSLVLLRNDGTLPLRPDVGSVAVIGPSADEASNLFGDYAYPAHVESLRVLLDSGDPFGHGPTDGSAQRSADVDARSVLAALRERLGERVTFARGCDVNTDARHGFDGGGGARA